MSMFGLPQGMNLGMLAGLAGGGGSQYITPGQQYEQMRRNPGYSDQQARAASGLDALNQQYQQELSSLRQQASRTARQLAGPLADARKYLSQSGGMSNPQEQRQLMDLMGSDLSSVAQMGRGGISGGRFYDDMLPFVDRYNQLRSQYQSMGLRI